MKVTATVSVLAASLGMLLSLGSAHANDGAIAYGGSPSLLSAHPNVAMKSEIIKMTISKQTVTVDCQFVFKNYGKKCEVRMGFPDQGEGSADPDEEYGDPEWKTKPAKSTFNWFKSWVDGKPVKTELIRSNKASLFWHAKTVSFAQGETKKIRDLYNVDTGGQIAPNGNGYYLETAYILHTGKSWRGKIERSEVVAIFSLPMDAKTLKTGWYRFDEKTYLKVDWTSLKNGKVLYHGPVKAKTKNLTMRFVRTNWEPEEKDDVWLAFAFQGPETNKSSNTTTKLPYVHQYPVTRTLTEKDLKGKTDTQLKLMRNAIYARHGRPFKDAELAKFFEAQSWYRKNDKWTEADDDNKLSKLEKQNAEFILSYAKAH